jgi:dimeric dUTPase (all-alpha-NTP-PPase superfamily)
MTIETLKTKMQQIVTMQDILNERTVPGWREANLDWDTAILVETAEAIDSCAWKWWKHQEPDIENLKVELVDLLHFVVSKIIIEAKDDYEPIKTVATNMAAHIGIWHKELLFHSPVAILNSFVKDVLNGDAWKGLMNLFVLFKSLGMSMDDIHQAYITKNLLNWYRQERGYKDASGGYIKVFKSALTDMPGETEDNAIFARIVSKIDTDCDLVQLKERAFSEMDAFVNEYKTNMID